MAFRLGIVGLCTSHPDAWVPIIRDVVKEKAIDVEIVVAWDSGETRPAGYAAELCRKHNIARPIENLEEMPPLVDGVIIHTANWDRHIEQAAVFVDAGKSVFIDKPIVGNLKDANRLLEWAKLGKRIIGGSSLRFSYAVREFLNQPEQERGRPHTAYALSGVDEFNYGIHAYALLAALMGPGIRSVRYIGTSGQHHYKLTWHNGAIGLLTVGKSPWMPFSLTVITEKKSFAIPMNDISNIYRGLIEVALPYLAGGAFPLTMEELLQPELAALAARVSRFNNGAEVMLGDLRVDDPGYDGTQFAVEYRRARLG